MTDIDARQKALELAHKLVALIDHPSTPLEEKRSAKRKLARLKTKWNLTDEEIRPPEPLEPDEPIDPGLTFDELLEHLGITRKQLQGFLGDLAVRGLTKLVSKITNRSVQ